MRAPSKFTTAGTPPTRSKDRPGKAESPNPPAVAEEEPLESAVPQLANTGERFLPGTRGTAEVAYDHIARYRLAECYVQGKEAIDLGCGAGYGTYSLARFATRILGVDFSEEAVAYATWCNEAPGLRYEVEDVTALPYPGGSFDTAVSFEVIEHLERPEALVEEARRLLEEDGVFVVSTPDKQTYSNDRNSVNPHHSNEMYPLEFRELLEHHFRHVQIYRQGALAGSIITPDSAELPKGGELILESTRFSLPDSEFNREVPVTLYMIAVCTNGPAPEPLQKPRLILDCDRQVYDEHADLHDALGALARYQAHEHRQEQARAERLRRRIDNMQNSRGWKIAQRLARFKAWVDRIFRRG
jgi:SAM-dependent methyltransferase